MIKWPEPIKIYGKSKNNPVKFGVYSESQLKQAVRDAYEEAAKLCDEQAADIRRGTDLGIPYSDGIRALIKEIE